MPKFIICNLCEVSQVATAMGFNEEGIGAACLDCIGQNEGPGKFQGLHGDDLGLALLLRAFDPQDFDQDMSNEGWGYCGQIGRYLFKEDPSGFVDVDTYSDVAAACQAFDSLYSDGMGAEEDDGYICFDRGEYCLYITGTQIGRYPREMRARAAMRLHAAKSGYYPNLWRQGERGDLTILSY